MKSDVIAPRGLGVVVGLVLAAMLLFAQTGSGDQLRQLVAQLQQSPNDYALREKIINLARTMDPPPALPDEAKTRTGRGLAAINLAKTPSDYKEAVAEFEKAALAAPWSATVYSNLGKAQAEVNDYGGAAASLRLYLLAAPGSKDAAAAEKLMYEMEFKQEMADKAAAEAKARADQAAAEAKVRADKSAAEAKAREEKAAADAKAREERSAAGAKARADKAIVDRIADAWTDSSTGLTWTKRDNGSEISQPEALGSCLNLSPAGHRDWRLPTIDELETIYDTPRRIIDGVERPSAPDVHIKGGVISARRPPPAYEVRIKGGIEVNSSIGVSQTWSSSSGQSSGEAWVFDFGSGMRWSFPLGKDPRIRALCVRGATADEKERADKAADKAAVDAKAKADKAIADRIADTWTDQRTGLTWTKGDNGSDITQPEALGFCQSLNPTGRRNWRLPTIDELKTVYDRHGELKGGIVLGSFDAWSSSPGKSSGEAWAFDFYAGKQHSLGTNGVDNLRALCARRAGE